MLKFVLLSLCTIIFLGASAAFVPTNPEMIVIEKKSNTGIAIHEMSVGEFEKLTGKKLNTIQKWQYKKLQKKLNRKSKFGIFPERDDLTEGFQALPFFGGILTIGILPLIMLFTARDRNALNWAFNGATIILGVISLIALLSGY